MAQSLHQVDRIDVASGSFNRMAPTPRFPTLPPIDGPTDAHKIKPEFGYHIEPRYLRLASKESIRICVANTIERRLLAWRLASTVYKQSGYAPSSSSDLFYGPHDGLPNTVTFLAMRKRLATGVVTVVSDGPLLLPADDVFNVAIQRLRQEGRSLCEVVSLASQEQGVRGARLMKHYCKLAFLVAYGLEGATDLLITVNPRHRTFYERTMLYTPLSGPVPYGKVNGAPAILLRLDIQKAFSAFRSKYKGLPASKNPLTFFLHRAQELIQWIKSNHGPMDQESLQRYFPTG